MKKLIAYLILLVITFSANAQTSLETAVFNELNSYRDTAGLCTLKVDKNLYSWAGYHGKYLVKLNGMGLVDATHNEKIDIPDWKELNYDQRDLEFNKSGKDNHFNGEVQLRSLSVLPGTSEKDIAKKAIQEFHDSRGHRDIIRTEFEPEYDLPIVGVSVIKNTGQVAGYDVYTIVIDLGLKFNYYQK
jgi:hypothetical protein